MESQKLKKLLIVRLSALGDTIHTIPLAVALKKQYPDLIIDWIVEDKASEFIINNPIINKFYEIPRRKWKNNKNKIANIKDFFSIIKLIRKEQYDAVIDVQQLFKSGLIMGLSGAKRKITLDNGREFSYLFANEIIYTGRKQFDINYHVVKRNMEFAKYLGCKNLDIEFKLPDFTKEINKNLKDIIYNIDRTKKTIVIAPATTWTNKHWISQKWSNVINSLIDKYNIIITASEKEKNITSEILLNTVQKDKIINLTGMTSLADLVYIYNNVDMVISPDSGSTHIAWACQNPYIITLFFATSKNRTAPFGDKYYALSPKIDCAPCMKRKCYNKSNPLLCRNNINSEEIINIVKNVLQ